MSFLTFQERVFSLLASSKAYLAEDADMPPFTCTWIATQALFEAKAKSGLTFEELAKAMGR